MTLIEVRGSDGSLRGRCDARCYGSSTPGCDCVCGGANHGVGLARALAQTSAAALALLPEEVRRAVESGEARLVRHVHQPTLTELEGGALLN